MAKAASTIALEADPNDPEDFDVTEAGIEAALTDRRNRGGRPVGSTTSDRQQVSLRLPRGVIEHFKADGPGWQTRVVQVLEREARTGRFSVLKDHGGSGEVLREMRSGSFDEPKKRA